MKSLTQLYKIGRGPSSSHTIGPQKIAEYAKKKYGDGAYKVILYGSLAKTGEGHGTAKVLKDILGEDVEITLDKETHTPHPNTMDIFFGDDKEPLRGYSIGGGSVRIKGQKTKEDKEVYPHSTFYEIKQFVKERDMCLSDYVFYFEPDIRVYLKKVWKTMCESIETGLASEGILPGGLNLSRKAALLYNPENMSGESTETKQTRLLCAYAFAVAETNADNGYVVTAPTCGAAGVLPAVLYYLKEREGYSEEHIIRALACAGIIGNVVKTNGSISGAECGCQAEIGTACSMTAAAVCSLYGLSVDQTECAAEVAMEHNLGLTCDPVNGLVQVPCIERNAMAAMRALDCFRLAYYLTDLRKISFDTIVKTMKETGHDMRAGYKETAEGGIAKNYNR